MKKVVITGLSGAIGSRFCEQLPKNCKIYDLYHKNKAPSKKVVHIKFDLLDQARTLSVLEKIEPDIILHLAAITHIDKCEKDKKNGKTGVVWKTNVDATENIAEFCSNKSTKIIFLSTECVFDGEKGNYVETSFKKPKNWYGVTKDEAEKIVLQNHENSAIVRSVVAFHENDEEKTLFGKFLKEFKNKRKFKAVSDQIITPTYTDDIVKSINILINNFQPVIFHISSAAKISPYEFALKIAKKFNFDQSLVIGTSLDDYFGKEKAKLRLKKILLNSKMTYSRLGFHPLTIDEALEKIRI